MILVKLTIEQIGSDGQCFKYCNDDTTTISHKPVGSLSFGGVFKFVIEDIHSFSASTRRVIVHTYGASATSPTVEATNIATGLASSSSYIDQLYFGCSVGSTSWTGIIPNSKLIALTQGSADKWWLQLYIEPGQYILWVGITLLCGLVVLASMIGGLYYQELAADSKQRLRERHALNFDAL